MGADSKDWSGVTTKAARKGMLSPRDSQVAVAFLNVISKGVFTMFLIRVRDDQRLREKVSAQSQRWRRGA